MKLNRIATVLAGLSITAFLLTAAGHAFLATPALLAELRKGKVDPEWITAMKSIWLLASVNTAFLGGLVALVCFRKAAISAKGLANAIGVLMVLQAAYLFFELGLFPGAVLMVTSGVLLLIAMRLSVSPQGRIE
ncbi:MAG: hypothetical protein JWO13_2902 [Acidobacteriales bacterium]|nr:hypothetical protein [Terriglobales bacterium]